MYLRAVAQGVLGEAGGVGRGARQPLLLTWEQHRKREDPTLGANAQLSSVFIGAAADAPHAKTVIASVALCGSRKPVFEKVVLTNANETCLALDGQIVATDGGALAARALDVGIVDEVLGKGSVPAVAA